MRRTFIVTFALLATAASAQGGGSFRIEETGQRFARLDDAVNAIGQGSGTIVVAPGRYPECAVFSGGNLTIRAEQPSTAIFEGGACEGKAVLVLRGQSATIDGLVFRNVRVPDLNGAGIRIEKGDLDVIRSTFLDSETGILSADDRGGTIRVERSTFSGLGGCTEGRCSHSLYIGDYGKLTVSRVRFERGRGGHYVKSRTPLIEVLDSSFDDSAGTQTNYTIDLPNGATGLIARNTIVVGKNKQNYSTVIAVAPEKRENPSAGLTIEGNDVSIVPGASYGTTFVGDWSREPLRVGTNKLGANVKLQASR